MQNYPLPLLARLLAIGNSGVATQLDFLLPFLPSKRVQKNTQRGRVMTPTTMIFVQTSVSVGNRLLAHHFDDNAYS